MSKPLVVLQKEWKYKVHSSDNIEAAQVAAYFKRYEDLPEGEEGDAVLDVLVQHITQRWPHLMDEKSSFSLDLCPRGLPTRTMIQEMCSIGFYFGESILAWRCNDGHVWKLDGAEIDDDDGNTISDSSWVLVRTNEGLPPPPLVLTLPRPSFKVEYDMGCDPSDWPRGSDYGCWCEDVQYRLLADPCLFGWARGLPRVETFTDCLASYGFASSDSEIRWKCVYRDYWRLDFGKKKWSVC